MNIALSAVVIIILLLPPIAFYLSFNLGTFPKAGPKFGLVEGAMYSALISILIHAIALVIIPGEIRFDILALLLGGDLKTFGSSVSNRSFHTMFLSFAWYNAILNISLILLARICRLLVQRLGWHVNSAFFRMYNYWWYLFRGYKVDEVIDRRRPLEFDIVFVDVLVNTNSGTMIYSGYLLDYICFEESLDRIYLSETIKREFKINQFNEKGNILVNEPGEPKEIDGNTMVIPYASIINMNLHFITLPEEFEDLANDPTLETPIEVISQETEKFHR
jgi:hypothetical protein